MKKILCILLFLCIGCARENKVQTIIEENDFLIGINYPVTAYKNLNNIIQTDVENIYTEFKKEKTLAIQQPELNIDYKLTEFESHISILLDIYISNITEKKPIHYVKTYFYDKEKQVILNITEILNQDSIAFIKNDLIKQKINIHYLNNYIKNLPFFVEKKQIHFYYNESVYNYSLEELNLKLTVKSNHKEIETFQPTNKVLDINKKYVAITFDDGPSIYTERILNTLKKHEVNATFFILGNKVSAYQDLLIQSLKNGNVIGNHSYNHKWLIKLKDNEIKNQIEKTNEEIQKYTGYTPTLLRPTYGSLNTYLKHFPNMEVVLWTVDTMDWKYKNTNVIVKRATNHLKDGDIILMHDIYKSTANSLDKIITEIKKKGFEIVTVLELKEIQKLRKYE